MQVWRTDESDFFVPQIQFITILDINILKRFAYNILKIRNRLAASIYNGFWSEIKQIFQAA
jgi:hypothetical protein